MTDEQIKEIMFLVDELPAVAVREILHGRRSGPGYAKSRAAVESALRAAVPEVPEGWKPVPVEPTQGMCDAAVSLKEYDQRRGALSVNSNIYRAMLESSPQAPQAAQPVQPSEQVRKPLSDAEIVLTASDVASLVCRSVAEIPDRNSPEDFPDAMLVTANELHGIVLDAITEWVDASAHNIREN
jgi:hypothetical protein